MLKATTFNDVRPPFFLKTGTTTIVGLVFQDGVILGADTQATEGPITADRDYDKFHYIAPDIHCCGVGAGTTDDTEEVIDIVSSQLEVQSFHTGQESRVATALILLKSYFSGSSYQGQGALVVGGVDITGPHLHAIYPNGSSDTLPYATSGTGSLVANAVFESKYRRGLTREEGIILVTEAICSGISNGFGSGCNIDICVITKGHADGLRKYLLPGHFKIPRLVYWKFPETGWVKLNTDGCSKGGTLAGGGGVVRNSSGDVLLAFCDYYGKISAFEAEVRAVLRGLSLCKECGFQNVWVEIDAQVVVQILDGSRQPWILVDVISRAADLLKGLGGRISHIYREGNKAADLLANYGLVTRSSSIITDMNCISGLLGTIALDQQQHPYLRL